MARKEKLWSAQSQISPKSDTHLTPKGWEDSHSQMVDNFKETVFSKRQQTRCINERIVSPYDNTPKLQPAKFPAWWEGVGGWQRNRAVITQVSYEPLANTLQQDQIPRLA